MSFSYTNTTDSEGQPSPLFNRARNGAKAVDQLVGICTGILADGEVNESEAIFFAEWLRTHTPNEPIWPFTDVLKRVGRIFADGVCDAEEREELKAVMQALCGYEQQTPPPLPRPQAPNLSTTLPLCAPQPELVFEGQQFVVTGKFAHGPRTAVFEAIERRGGQPTDAAPTKASNYLVVGVFSSRDWVNTSHGRKIEKAVQLRTQGTGIRIVSEAHWKGFVS